MRIASFQRPSSGLRGPHGTSESNLLLNRMASAATMTRPHGYVGHVAAFSDVSAVVLPMESGALQHFPLAYHALIATLPALIAVLPAVHYLAN